MEAFVAAVERLLIRMNANDAILSIMEPQRANGEAIGGVVVVAKDHWEKFREIAEAYNREQGAVTVKTTVDRNGDRISTDEEDRQEYGIGG